ncbi:DUF7282 domain-containing protein [Halorussus halophilus]|uniref:DUF7282 domain-containing protein n=1 Tax=Halorussus halophilus TaxID=2650975 RepID=UPI0013011519|nr:hypothetical protein [Halorussus halophilus]
MTVRAKFGVILVATLLVTSGMSAVVGATAVSDTGTTSAESLSQDTQTNQTTEASATVTFSDQPSNGSAVVVNATNVSEGGFVVIFAQNGTLLGNSTYLEPGDHENVTVTLNTSIGRSQVLVAVPHQDTNDNQRFDFNATAARQAATTAQNASNVSVTDGPYVRGRLPVSAVSFVTVSGDDRRRNASE